MSRIDFAELPDHARLWVFPADRELSPQESEALLATVDGSLAAWNAHGSPVRWGRELRYGQVLLIGVDETHTALSGCSIDSATREIGTLESRLGVALLDHGRVFYRDAEALRWAPRPEFKQLAEAGRVTADTVVLDNVIATVGELRAGRWEVPARSTWHARAFPLK